MVKPSVNFEFVIGMDVPDGVDLDVRSIPYIRVANDGEYSVTVCVAEHCVFSESEKKSEERFVRWRTEAGISMDETEISRLIDILQISLKLLLENQEMRSHYIQDAE